MIRGVNIQSSEDTENKHNDFIKEIANICNIGNPINIFFLNNIVKGLSIGNKVVYLWQDAKGKVCYSFDLLEKEYFTTTATKLSSVLSSHFQCNVEVVKNINEEFSKKSTAVINANKAIQTNHGLPQQQQVQEVHLNQERVGLSQNQYRYTKEVVYLYLNTLPLIHKEQFRPYMQSLFYEQNALMYKNSYIPSRYMTMFPNNFNVEQSFILSFILAMAKNDFHKAMSIIGWLAISFNLLQKLPFVLVLHSKNDTAMRLFYEEIVEPLLNKEYCETISNDALDKKTLSQKLNEKVIYHFHNITTTTILEEDAKELLKKLIYKEEYKINNKYITTVANILITSTSRYIPLIAKDVPCIVVDVPSNLEKFCREKNIGTDYYAIARFIQNDLVNFGSILIKYINSDNPYVKEAENQYYNGIKNSDIIDGDVDVIKVFESAIKTKDEAFFQKIKLQAPKLYTKLSDDFSKNRIDRKNLIEYFFILFGKDIVKTNRELISKLKEISTTAEPFENEDTFNNNGRVYYKINNKN